MDHSGPQSIYLPRLKSIRLPEVIKTALTQELSIQILSHVQELIIPLSSSFFLSFKREPFTRPVVSQQPPVAVPLKFVAVFQMRPHPPCLAPSERLSVTLGPGPGHFRCLKHPLWETYALGFPIGLTETLIAAHSFSLFLLNSSSFFLNRCQNCIMPVYSSYSYLSYIDAIRNKAPSNYVLALLLRRSTDTLP